MTLPELTLACQEICPDRPFTHPDHTLEDIAVLRGIARQVRACLLQTSTPARLLRGAGLEGRPQRLVLCAPAALRAARGLTVVGFFGQRRPAADPRPMDQVDEALVEEFAQHPHILAYCSQELPTGQWGNLVLLANPEAGQAWRGSERHRRAVETLAPVYYSAVRLHNAELPNGLLAGAELLLHRTKYYDYQAGPWRAVRECAPPARIPFD